MSIVYLGSASHAASLPEPDDAPSPPLPPNVADPAETPQEPGRPRSCDTGADRSNRQEETPLEGLTTAQLMGRRAARTWLAPGLLARHESAVILGPSKSLKTSLAIDLCGALASGGKFLGQFAVEQPFRVGYVGGEETEHAAPDLAHRWSAAADVDLANLDRLIWGLNIAELGDPAQLRRLTAWIERYQLEAVVIDQAELSNVSPRAQARQLRDISRCCLEAGATPIFCCPTRSEPPPRALSAADLAAAPGNAVARQWLLVNRRQPFEPGSGRHQLWLTLGGGAGQSGLWGVDIDEGQAGSHAARKWQVQLRDVAAIEEETARLAAKSRIEHLRWRLRGVMSQIAPAQSTKLKIREQSGMSGAKFGLAWQQLVDAGEIRVVADNDPHKRSRQPRYRLVDLAERTVSGSDPRDETFVTMTSAELAQQADPASPTGAAQRPDSRLAGPGQALPTALHRHPQRSPGPLFCESPHEKKSLTSPVRALRKARKRREKARRRKR
ncbi:MAG: AAA family ATPase [Blastopirellula sp. JB062]